MQTYKIVIQSDLSKIALKDYTVKYVDVKAENAESAVVATQLQQGKNFVVELVSVM